MAFAISKAPLSHDIQWGFAAGQKQGLPCTDASSFAEICWNLIAHSLTSVARSEDLCLRTKRLLLRPLVRTDAPVLQAIAADPQVALSTSSIPHPYPANGAADFIAGQMESAGRDRQSFAVTLREIGEFVGLCGYTVVNSEADLRYLIAASHWRRGLATEAARAVVIHLFGDRRVQAITATAMTTNPGSIGVLRKLGFVRKADTMMHLPLRGGEHLISNWRLERSCARHDRA